MVKFAQLVFGTEWLLGNCGLLLTVSFVTGCIILSLFFVKHIGRPLHCILLDSTAVWRGGLMHARQLTYQLHASIHSGVQVQL